MTVRPVVRSMAIAVSLFAALTSIGTNLSGQNSPKDGEWPTYGGDLKSTKYKPFDQINAANFGKLQVAWRFKTDNLGTRPEGRLEGTPVMANGVLYATGGTR